MCCALAGIVLGLLAMLRVPFAVRACRHGACAVRKKRVAIGSVAALAVMAATAFAFAPLESRGDASVDGLILSPALCSHAARLAGSLPIALAGSDMDAAPAMPAHTTLLSPREPR